MGLLGVRIIILAGMGLAALYMLHILAQDFNRIRQPVRTVTRFLLNGRFRRDTTSNDNIMSSSYNNTLLNYTMIMENTINWSKILRNDPLSCLQSLICQIFAEEDRYRNVAEAKNIREFLNFSINYSHDVPEKISTAHHNGITFKNNSNMCYIEYPYCFYSAETMLKILKFFL